jgi:hypothetical protein
MSITKLAPWQSAGPTRNPKQGDPKQGANVGPNGTRRIITGMLTTGTDLSNLLPNRQPNQLLPPPPPPTRPFDDKL